MWKNHPDFFVAFIVSMNMSELPVIIEIGDGASIPSPKDKGLFSAWWVSFLSTLTLLAYLLIFRPDPYLKIFKFLPDGIIVTFQVTFASICLALVLGLLAGLGRISQNRMVNLVASTYVIKCQLLWPVRDNYLVRFLISVFCSEFLFG